MKIAIPTVDGLLCQHFGHCEQFAIVEVDPESKEIHQSRMHTPPHHEPGVLPQWLREMGCDVVIAGGMGRRALEHFQRSGITVVIGAAAGSPERTVTAYLEGNLDTQGNLCEH